MQSLESNIEILLRATRRKTLGAREQDAEKAWWEDRYSSNKGSPQPSVAPLSQHFPVRQQWNHIWRVYWWPLHMGHTMTSLKHFLNLKHSWYTVTEVHPSPIFSSKTTLLTGASHAVSLQLRRTLFRALCTYLYCHLQSAQQQRTQIY